MKTSDDVILHVICRLGPPIKNPGYVYAKIQEIFMFGYFPFNLSRNNAVLEQRTGHFRGLVGLDTKAKDLSFEAKAKDFKMYPSGRGRPQGRHLW